MLARKGARIKQSGRGLAHTRAMISGWEEVKDIEAVEDWEIKTKAA